MRLRGGTREGWVRTAWPSAELAVSTDRLRITGLGTYDLKPDDVVSIEPYRGFPFLGRGILVRHNRAEYPTTLVFFFAIDQFYPRLCSVDLSRGGNRFSARLEWRFD